MEKISLFGIIVTDILLILGFVIGKTALHKAQNAVKFFAYFSVLICSMLVLNFISIISYSAFSLIAGSLIHACAFPVFLFTPFIIGHFTSYEKVHLFTNIQILTLIISLVMAISFI